MEKNRRRPHQVKIRMSTAEYRHLKTRLKKSGMTQQALIMCALLGIRLTTPEELEQLRMSNEILKEICQNMRAIGNNINQIARHSNQCSQVSKSDIDYLKEQVERISKENNKLWQLSRYLIVRLQGTHHCVT